MGRALMRRIYLASSWRNPHQPELVVYLRGLGHQVYDFRNPKEHVLERDQGFHWSDIDPAWQGWTPRQFRQALEHPLAIAGFESDYAALEWSDTVVLLNPSGRSAHSELFQANGQGKPTCILLAEGDEPELMYSMASTLVVDRGELALWLMELDVVPEPTHTIQSLEAKP